MAIWDAVKELEGLQQKAAEGKDIEDKDTFQVRAALKERGWEGLVCEEAISRGYKKFRGEEVDFPSWYIADNILPAPPEVQGSEAPTEKQEVSRRLFNLLGGISGEEPKEQEEIFEDLVASPAPQNPAEHVAYLNGIHMLKTGNPEWEDYLWIYMKKYKLKPTDMEGLAGPRPWMNDPLWYDPDEEEIPEPPYAGIGLGKEAQLAALEEASGPPFPGSENDLNLAEFRKIFGPTQKEETMEKETKLEEKVSGTRQRVHVGDEIGWICKPCNRVWGLDEITCPSCDGEPGYQTVFPAAKQAADKAIVLALGKKKDNKDLAIEAMHKALGYDLNTGVEIPEDATECEACGADDYLECDCCLECGDEACRCCDECSRYPCQCDKEQCPICLANIPIAEACPHGCDSDIKELQQLYEDVKDSKDFNFKEKLKFMSLLKEKIGLATDVAGPNEHEPEIVGNLVAQDDEPGFEEEENEEE